MNKPGINYLLTLLTGGLFGFYWLFSMAKQVQISGYLFKTKFFSVTLILYLLTVFFLISQVAQKSTGVIVSNSILTTLLPVWLFSLVIILFYLIFSTLSAVSKGINEKGVGAPQGLKLYLLFALYLVALPLLQVRLNKIPNKRQH